MRKRWFSSLLTVLSTLFVLYAIILQHESVITSSDGDFRCSIARSLSGRLYTAGHCKDSDGKLYLNGKEVPYVSLPGDIIQIGQSQYQDDNGILEASKVKPKMKVKARIGGLSAITKEPYYFERDGTILAVLTSEQLNHLFDSSAKPGFYALADIGSFAGCSGSGVYYKKKLIGVIIAGTGDYSLIALITPDKKEVEN